jgi:hypothetical protein
MKFLKISEKNNPNELIDLQDLQIELLRNGLEFDLIRQYTKIVSSFRKKTFFLMELANSDFEKFTRIINGINEEYKKFYIDNNDGFFESGIPVLFLNPLNKRIIRFYYTGLEHAFLKLENETFNYFYNELLLFLRKLTNSELNQLEIKTKDFFTGEDTFKFEVRLIKMFREIMFELCRLITVQIANAKLNSDQVIFSARLQWSLFFDLILDFDFEILMLEESIQFWEQLLFTFSARHNEPFDTFLIISKELHIYSDNLIRYQQELYVEIFEKKRDLVDKCIWIISNRDFVNFEKDLLNSKIDNSSTEYNTLTKVAKFGLKVSMLRMALIRVYANLLSKYNAKVVVDLLFARQPINSNFINSNNDFFPTEVGFIKRFLIVYKNQRHFGLNYLRFESQENQIDQVVLIWLYRNAFWSIQRNGSKVFLNLGEFKNGQEVSQILNNLKILFKVTDQLKNDELPTIKLNNEDGLNLMIFKNILLDEIDRISHSHELQIQNSDLDSEKKNNFLEQVKSGTNHYKGLFNLFTINEIKGDENDIILINNTETFDKTPFLSEGIAENISINAHEVFPKLCVQNYSLKRDVIISKQIIKYCNSHKFTISEMEQYFLNNSFNGKLIITNYLNLGYEILRGYYSFDDGTFHNLKNEKYQINQINSFNYSKFVFVLDESKTKTLIQSNELKIEMNLVENNNMNAEVKMTSKIRINILDGLIGDFFFLR